MIDTKLNRIFGTILDANPKIGKPALGQLLGRMIDNQQIFHTEDGFALFIRLDPYSLARVKDNVNLLINPVTLAEYLYGKGNNIHIIGVYAYNKNKILPWLRVFIKHYNPDSVSWFNRELKFRRLICRQ